MATSFEHRALVEQLRALTQKRAENPGEQILNTSHPSGSNSSADDHTRPAVVGHRYAENSADNKAMYPLGTDGDAKLEAGSQQKDPGHNKGVKVRPSGEAPEVERKYNLNDHNDPGSSHPSAKAAQAFISEARGLAAELRNLIKASAGKSDSYVSGDVAEEATDDTDDNASGTRAYPPNADNDGNISLSKEQGKDAASKLAEARAMATRELFEMREGMKESAATDATSFVASVAHVMGKFAAPHISEFQEAEKQAHVEAQVEDVTTKIAMYDLLAQRDNAPSFTQSLHGAEKQAHVEAQVEDVTTKIAMYDLLAERDGALPFSRVFKKLANDVQADEEAAASDCEEPNEDADGEEEQEAEQVLNDMAQAPAGGQAPDAGSVDPAMMAAMQGGDPGAAGGAAPQLSPEEEAALMALMQQEGMKESDVKSFAKISSLLASGRVNANTLSQAQIAFMQTCDGAVKRAGAKFQTLRSASRLRTELNSIYKGIN